MDVLVTYDISTNTKAGVRRLARVAKACEGFGVRVQYSVFECRLSAAALVRLIGEITDVIDPSCDSVHLYRFDGQLALARTSLGMAAVRNPGQHWIL